jgi:hypothetical protein
VVDAAWLRVKGRYDNIFRTANFLCAHYTRFTPAL